MRTIVLLAAIAFSIAGPAAAVDVIWKCRDAKGSTIYQNAPCGAGQRDAGLKVFNSVADDPRAIAKARRAQVEMDQRNASLHRIAWRSPTHKQPSARERARKACELSKAAAHDAAMRGDAESKREMLERRAIDACFGF